MFQITIGFNSLFLPYEDLNSKFREQSETSDVVVDYFREVLSCNDLNNKRVAEWRGKELKRIKFMDN